MLVTPHASHAILMQYISVSTLFDDSQSCGPAAGCHDGGAFLSVSLASRHSHAVASDSELGSASSSP